MQLLTLTVDDACIFPPRQISACERSEWGSRREESGAASL